MRAVELLTVLFLLAVVVLVARYTFLAPWFRERKIRALERGNARLDDVIDSDSPRRRRRTRERR